MGEIGGATFYFRKKVEYNNQETVNFIQNEAISRRSFSLHAFDKAQQIDAHIH